MKVTNYQIQQAYITMAKYIDKPIKGILALQIIRNLKALEEENKNIETIRVKLLEKYSTKDAEGKPVLNDSGNYDITSDNINLFTEEYLEILNASVDIEINPINAKDIEQIEISVKDLACIEFMINY